MKNDTIEIEFNIIFSELRRLFDKNLERYIKDVEYTYFVDGIPGNFEIIITRNNSKLNEYDIFKFRELSDTKEMLLSKLEKFTSIIKNDIFVNNIEGEEIYKHLDILL